MLKTMLRILAAIVSTSLLAYFFIRKVKIWEIEAVKKQPQLKSPVAKQQIKEDSKQIAEPPKGGKINFDRIGVASAEEKDDLKQIKGIGPTMEEKLNALGIYTFDQIANFTAEDEAQVAEATEYFPGRIERDEWVKQAKALKKQKNS